jgi:hypothetical protein
MIEHLVLFKAKSGTPPDRLEAMVKALAALKGQVPGILDISAGENFSARSQGYTHGLFVRFPDRSALDSYQSHPAHQDVVSRHVKPHVEAVLALDYEFH